MKTRTTSAVFTKELDDAIRNYCFNNSLPVNQFFIKCGMSWNNYYVIRRRGIIGQNSIRKIKKLLKNFDFTSLPKVDDYSNERN